MYIDIYNSRPAEHTYDYTHRDNIPEKCPENTMVEFTPISNDPKKISKPRFYAASFRDTPLYYHIECSEIDL